MGSGAGQVLAQIVAKTDGIPLFIEELVKTILAAGLVPGRHGPLCAHWPAAAWRFQPRCRTTLMARLDRLAVVKRWRSSGRSWGGSFHTSCCRRYAPQDEVTLQQALAQLMCRPKCSINGGCHRMRPMSLSMP